MRKLILLALVLTGCLFMPHARAAEGGSEWTVVHLDYPGELMQKCYDLLGSEWTSVTRLKVTGQLNALDFADMRKMTTLEALDLGGATLPDNEVPASAFEEHPSLEAITLPASTVRIADRALFNCYLLRSVAVAGDTQIAEIGHSAFYNDASLEEFDLSAVKVLGNSTFNRCSKLDCKDARGIESLGEAVFNSTGTTEVPEGFFAESVRLLPMSTFESCHQLTTVFIPDNIVDISGYAFAYCEALTQVRWPNALESIGYGALMYTGIKEIFFPETIGYIGDYLIGGVRDLRKITCLSPLVPRFFVNDYTLSNLDLNKLNVYVPNTVLERYRTDENWGNFKNINGVDATFTALNVYSPATLIVREDESDMYPKGLKLHVGNDAALYSAGELTIGGKGKLEISDLTIDFIRRVARGYEFDYTPMASIVNHMTDITAERLTLNLLLPGQKWTMLMLPFDVKFDEIVRPANGNLAVRTYDSQARAEGRMRETWADVRSGDLLKARQGFMVQSVADDDQGYRISLPATPETIADFLTTEDITVPISAWDAELDVNMGWNFVGNPWPSFMSPSRITTGSGEPLVAPITVWNQSGFRGISPIDDADEVLFPYEGFFVQNPGNIDCLVFEAAGRLHKTEIEALRTSGTSAPARIASDAERRVFNFRLDGCEFTNRARLVLNEEASLAYEPGRDASKFMDAEEGAPIIYVYEGSACEIAERPYADGTATLGLRIATAGEYTLSLSGRNIDGWQVTLTDNATGETADLSAADYRFTAVPTDDPERFSLSLSNIDSGLQAPAVAHAAGYAVYTVTGLKIYEGSRDGFHAPAAGVYVVIENGKANKMLISK